MKIIFILMMLTSVFQASAFVTVGTDASCDYDNLQDAYNDPDNFIRVTNQAVFNDEFPINKSQWFTGGYDNCTLAEQGTLSNNKSKWRRVNEGSVVSIGSIQGEPQSLVVFSGFEFFGGNNGVLTVGGGFDIFGNATVLLSQSEIYDNSSARGAGIYILGEQAQLTLTDVTIRNNTTTGPGGGISCRLGATVNILGDSAIHNNEATLGGGIHASGSCKLTVRSGDSLPALQVEKGIFANVAEQGGGIYLSDGAQLDLEGNSEHPASVIFNSSTLDDGNEGGGGFFIHGENTRLDAINARIDANLAKTYGGGGVVLDQAIFTMRRADGPCWSEDHCSSMSYNMVTGVEGVGGALDVYDVGTASIAQTRFESNRANDVAILDSSEASYVRLEGNVFHANRHWNDDSGTQLFEIAGQPGNGGNLDFFYNTLANNSAHAVFSLSAGAQNHLSVHNAIIQHPLTQDDNNDSNNIVEYDCVFLSENNSITGNIGIINGNDPLFVDGANGNYQLQDQSPAIDHCDEQTFIGASYADITGQDRGFNDPGVQNFLGSHDAGAYERNDDVIFANSFD